jgi:hypothetical protein
VLLALVAAVALIAPAAPGPSPAGPRYFFILFAGQSVPFVPRTAHTWATFVKATPLPDGTTLVEPVTISWLPVDGDVRLRNLLPVRGKNYTLEETFAVMAGYRAQVSYWGPYEIDAGRYERAVAQAARLESGQVRYRVIDSFRNKSRVVHCVHAVTHADPVLEAIIQPVLRVGEPGTSKLAAKYAASGAFVGGPVTHDWVLSAVGADGFPAIPRQPGEHIRRRWLR